MAGPCSSDARFYGSIRLLARLNALEEILHVGGGSVDEAFFAEDGILSGLDALAARRKARAA